VLTGTARFKGDEISVAVMVDLGWPWWVTSLIAAGVVAAALIAFAVSRRPAVRGIAAVLIVQGVASALVAPFVMDEDEDRDGSPAMASPAAMSGGTENPLSREEFVRQADANCRELGQFAAALGNPTTSAGIARKMDRMMPEFWSRIAAQARLTPPMSQGAMAEQWMNAMAAVGSDFEALRNAAKRKDMAALQAANRSSAVHSKEAARLSSQLGLKVCFQQ
jgi:hypothetical protein